MTKIITISSFHGESGCSTLAANISNVLGSNTSSQHEENTSSKVLLIDLNPNMGLTIHILFSIWKYEEIDKEISNLKKEGKFKEKTKTESDNIKRDVSEFIDRKINLHYYLQKGNEFYTARDIFNPLSEDKEIILQKINESFDFLPSHPKLMFLNPNTRGEFLKDFFIKKELIDKYDYIILDVPPIPSTITRLTLIASTHFLYIFNPSKSSFNGIPIFTDYYIPDFEITNEIPFPETRIISNLVTSSNKKWLNIDDLNKGIKFIGTKDGIPKSACITHLKDLKKLKNRFLPIQSLKKNPSPATQKINKEILNIRDFLYQSE